ncbi:splicing factor YJU2-like isoform X2 [Cornus florida]|uniref:splicing factor YJU2-like isoform X2 n=1 Tax=Cornus florida TaxID=4283 RepID=UPI00289A7509|nr:splicing factor YJU2-like isoform X2 [Cornus florida]
MASSDSDSDLHRRMFMFSGTQPVARIPPHRPKESLGPNQYLACTALPLSLICDSCGNRMPKCSRIAVTHDVSGKNRLDLTWSKIYVDCTSCIAEITLKRKGLKFVVLSGATPYFRPEDEKLECPGKRRRITQGLLS